MRQQLPVHLRCAGVGANVFVAALVLCGQCLSTRNPHYRWFCLPRAFSRSLFLALVGSCLCWDGAVVPFLALALCEGDVWQDAISIAVDVVTLVRCLLLCLASCRPASLFISLPSKGVGGGRFDLGWHDSLCTWHGERYVCRPARVNMSASKLILGGQRG